MTNKLYIVVEGHGEVLAALNLVNRLWADLGCIEQRPEATWDKQPIRAGGKLKTQEGIRYFCQILRSKRDCGGVLFLRDEDDLCPKEEGPKMADWLRAEALPFPVASVLIYREFETLFLPCLPKMAGRPFPDGRAGIIEGAAFEGDPQSKRDAKGQITRVLPPGRAYKPTLDQLPLTRMLDFPTLRDSGLPCFGTLERALTFLASASGSCVYPQMATS
jgi:hypothetical protein